MSSSTYSLLLLAGLTSAWVGPAPVCGEPIPDFSQAAEVGAAIADIAEELHDLRAENDPRLDPSTNYQNTFPDLDNDAATILEDPTDPTLGITTDTSGEPILFLDIFKAMGNETVKDQNFILKVPTALWEGLKETGKYTTQSPWHIVGAAAAGLISWEAANGGVSDLFSSSDGDSGRDINIVGDGNQVRDVSPFATIKIKGNANTVDASTTVDQQGPGLGP